MTEQATEPALEPAAPPAAESSAQAPEGVLKGDRGTETALVWFSAFLILVTGCAAYANVYGIPWQGLDLELIRNRTQLHYFVSVPQAFAHFPAAPLTLFSYSLNWSLTPDRAGEFHLFGLLFHLANAILLYLVCRKLSRGLLPEPVAMLSGMLFAVHPLGSEALVYLVGRPMLLGTFFALLCVLLLLRIEERRPTSFIPLALALCAYALAVASCFAFALLPVALIAFHNVLTAGEDRARLVRMHTPFLLLMLGIFTVIGAQPSDPPFPPEESPGGLAVMSHLAGRFLALAPTPLRLSPAWDTTLLTGISWFGLLVWLLLLGAAGALLIKRAFPGAGLLWSAALLAGAAFLLPADQAFSERALYPVLAGLCLLVPWCFLLVREPLPRKVLGGVAAVVILAALWQTFLRTALWQDPVLLWREVADNQEDAVLPHVYVARYLETQVPNATNDLMRNALGSEIAGSWQRVLSVDPLHVDALVGLGVRRYGQQNLLEAIPPLETALRLAPDNQQAALYLALAHDAAAQGEDRPEKLVTALQYYEHAQNLGPLPPDLVARIGLARLQAGSLGTALPLLAAAAQSEPEGPIASTLQQLMPVAERIAQLEQQAQQLVQANPADINVPLMRAEAKLMRGDTLHAFYLLDRMLRRDNSLRNAAELLAVAHAGLGSPARFIEEWGHLFANQPDMWRQLARRTAQAGQWPAALAYLEEQARLSPGGSPVKLQLADVAMELQQMQAAQNLLQEFAVENPESPAPWLKLADIAIAVDNREEAQRLLAEARSRGAEEAEVAKRADKVGVAPEAVPTVPRRAIIR